MTSLGTRLMSLMTRPSLGSMVLKRLKKSMRMCTKRRIKNRRFKMTKKKRFKTQDKKWKTQVKKWKTTTLN